MGLVITLIILGLLLLFAEILIIPGVGVAGILGLMSLAGSCVYAFLEISTTAGVVVTAVLSVLLVALTIYVLRAKTWKRISLNTNIESKAVEDIAVSVGDEGKTLTRLVPMGQALLGGESVEVKALEGMIDPDVEVVVVMIDDNKIYVKPKENEF
jgi:membrane-bound ClpP family serine protease